MNTRILILFFGGWFLLNGLQALFTDLATDEAYYWVYSTRLDWGYFDHPPLVSLFARAGYIFFKNELGVRLMTILSQVAALLLLYRYLIPAEVRKTRTSAILMVMVLIPILHVYVFIASPDAPLLLATVIFLIVYKKFLSQNSWTHTLLLGASFAFLLYSKYYGVLIIGFIILSNPRIILNYKFLAASLFGACLFIPHIAWQVNNGFISLRWHLVSRNNPFQFHFVWLYVLNQLINFNPVILVVAGIHLFRSKLPTEKFERGLVFLTLGFFIFFLLMTTRGHIEPQWTYVVLVPIIILIAKYATRSQLRIIFYSGFIVLPILLFGRINLIFNLHLVKTEFHGNRELVKEINKHANGLPVFVLNSHQLTSLYHFYSKERSYGIAAGGRKNQYDIWKEEDLFFGKRIYLVSRIPGPAFEEINPNGDHRAFGKVVDSFSFYRNVKIKWNVKPLLRSGIFSDTLLIENPYQVDINIREKSKLKMYMIDSRDQVKDIELAYNTELLGSGSSTMVLVTGKAPIQPGHYSIAFGLRETTEIYTINSPPCSVRFR